MEFQLTAEEVRVLGSLIEKSETTPDTYPLSLNALATACNQKTNRSPVMEIDESLVLEAVDNLIDKGLAARRSGPNLRVLKYSHRLSHRLRDDDNFSESEQAVLCVLFVRGPQTVGEIRTHCARLHDFNSLDEVQATLDALTQHPSGGCVVDLPRAPGQKEIRYVHLFSGEPDLASLSATFPPNPVTGTASIAERLSDMEARLDALTQRFDEFVKQFE